MSGKQSAPPPPSYPRWKEMFGLDLRSLALFRIMVSCACLFDLYHRALDLRAMYTDEGILPRYAVLKSFTEYVWFSVHMANGTVAFAVLVFSVHALILCCHAIGYRTRLMAVLAWVMCLSLQNRNTLCLHSGDVYMRCILFFSMLLPTGAVYSVDAALSRNKLPHLRHPHALAPRPPQYLIASWATVALIAQVVIMYVFSVYHKSGPEWTENYSATWWALQLDFFRKPLGDFFLMCPKSMLAFLTWAVWEWEKYGPILYMFPIFTGKARMFCAVAVQFMHASFGLCLRLAMFTMITTSTQFALYPSELWDRWVFPRLYRQSRYRGVIVAYGPRKKWYETLARLVAMFYLLPDAKVRPIASSTVEDDVLRIVDGQGREHSGVRALVALCHASPLLWWLEWAVASRPGGWLTGKVFTVIHVADRLFVYGRSDLALGVTDGAATSAAMDGGMGAEPMSPPAQQRQDVDNAFVANVWEFIHVTFWTWRNVIALAAISLVFFWNMANVHEISGIPREIAWIGPATELSQMWAMFSPRPPKQQFYYLMNATLADGRNVDLFRNRGLFEWGLSPFKFEKPPTFAQDVKNHRWFKMYEALNYGQGYKDQELMRLAFGRYVCREFNARHSGAETLWKWKWLVINEDVLPDSSRRIANWWIMWEHVCFDEKPVY